MIETGEYEITDNTQLHILSEQLHTLRTFDPQPTAKEKQQRVKQFLEAQKAFE